jgi:hypothetical protein
MTATNHRKCDIYLDTLAAAYAEVGEFAKAVGAEKDALAVLQDGRAKPDFESRLKLYESNLPYHEPDQTTAPAP